LWLLDILDWKWNPSAEQRELMSSSRMFDIQVPIVVVRSDL
jgi:hypothetical protein